MSGHEKQILTSLSSEQCDQSFFSLFLCLALRTQRYQQSGAKKEEDTERSTETKENESKSNSGDSGSESSGKIISSVKSIEDSCDLFLKQTFFAKYFLLCLGINVIDEVTNMKKEERVSYNICS